MVEGEEGKKPVGMSIKDYLKTKGSSFIDDLDTGVPGGHDNTLLSSQIDIKSGINKGPVKEPIEIYRTFPQLGLFPEKQTSIDTPIEKYDETFGLSEELLDVIIAAKIAEKDDFDYLFVTEPDDNYYEFEKNILGYNISELRGYNRTVRIPVKSGTDLQEIKMDYLVNEYEKIKDDSEKVSPSKYDVQIKLLSSRDDVIEISLEEDLDNADDFRDAFPLVSDVAEDVFEILKQKDCIRYEAVESYKISIMRYKYSLRRLFSENIL